MYRRLEDGSVRCSHCFWADPDLANEEKRNRYENVCQEALGLAEIQRQIELTPGCGSLHLESCDQRIPCGRHRPDLLYTSCDRIVTFEWDEHGHRGYDPDKETRREAAIQAAFGDVPWYQYRFDSSDLVRRNNTKGRWCATPKFLPTLERGIRQVAADLANPPPFDAGADGPLTQCF